MSKCTYGDNILDRLKDIPVEGQAGATWKYQGGNTLLLQEILLSVIDVSSGGVVLRKDLGAHWSDRRSLLGRGQCQGHERNYACFYTTASELPGWASSSGFGQGGGTPRSRT